MSNYFTVQIHIPPKKDQNCIFSSRMVNTRVEAEQLADLIHSNNKARHRDGCLYYICEHYSNVHTDLYEYEPVRA